MKFGSLFAGIGGFDLGLERAGMECAWQVEIDDYCNKVLEKHWPKVKRYKDVREVGKHNLEPVDLICGGFPCQDISVAGKQEGINGERSGLWYEYKRIIKELRPKWVFIENVANLRAKGLVVVLKDLWEIGYDAEWHIIPASAVGALHRRERVWIVAYANSTILREQHRRSSGQDRKGQTKPWNDGKKEPLANANEITRSNFWSAEPNVGRVANGVPNRMDRLKCLGNAVVPQIPEIIGRAILKTNRDTVSQVASATTAKAEED